MVVLEGIFPNSKICAACVDFDHVCAICQLENSAKMSTFSKCANARRENLTRRAGVQCACLMQNQHSWMEWHCSTCIKTVLASLEPMSSWRVPIVLKLRTFQHKHRQHAIGEKSAGKILPEYNGKLVRSCFLR